MTLEELSQLFYLRREIETDKERLQELKVLAVSAPVQTISDMPTGPNDGESRVERYVTDIMELEQLISEKIIRLVSLRLKLEKFIQGIPDSRLRLIFIFRFDKALSWVQVANRISHSETVDGVKHACYRYLDAVNARTDGEVEAAAADGGDAETGAGSGRGVPPAGAGAGAAPSATDFLPV